MTNEEARRLADQITDALALAERKRDVRKQVDDFWEAMQKIDPVMFRRPEES